MRSDTLLSNAKKYLGKPYVWGGESDEEGGYDCSGFVFCALRDSGLTVARTTAKGLSVLGTSCSSICAGDLLFFGSPITHVAIALNSTQMIESIGSSKNTKNNKGKGVSISNINRRKDLTLIKRVCDTASCKESTKMTLLKKGTKSNDVAIFESIMIKLGHYTGSIDNIYGSGCENACKAFQTNYGLTVDGQCGTNTWSKIFEVLKA